jgi:drug/metabolite transporter (DMT)-like permease
MKIEYLLISLFVGFLWGISPIMQKHLLKKFDKLSLMFFFAFIYIFFIIIASVNSHKTIWKDYNSLTNHDALIILAYVFFTSFLTNLLILHVLKSHDSYIVCALEGTAPLFTLFMVYLFFDEKITTIGVLGVFLIALGIFCIAFNGSTSKVEEFIGLR